MPRKRLVLLGVGHTNAHIVREWKRLGIPNCDLVCISQFPNATYSGMLPGTLGGQFDDHEWRVDLKALCERANAELMLADVSSLDLENSLLHFSDGHSISFDALSIGVGSMPANWSQHADQASLVPTKPMQTFLRRLDDRLIATASELSSTIRVAVVGGGVASVEIAVCLLQRQSQLDLPRDLSVDIYTSRNQIADGMQPKSVERIERLLAQRGIGITKGDAVIKVSSDSIETSDGRQHPADIVVWATGAEPPPVLAKLNLQTDERGFIATSKTLQSLSDPRVFAVGDAGTIIESPSPKAGVYAVRQIPILEHNLKALLMGETMKSFNPQASFLKLINTGDGKALMEYGHLVVHSRWCWHLKTAIDKTFVRGFQNN